MDTLDRDGAERSETEALIEAAIPFASELAELIVSKGAAGKYGPLQIVVAAAAASVLVEKAMVAHAPKHSGRAEAIGREAWETGVDIAREFGSAELVRKQ